MSVLQRSPHGTDRGARPVFLPARPITQVHLAALTERVRRRVVGWFRMQQLFDADAATDMVAWENSMFSVNASVRITLIDRDVPSYCRSLEHVLRYCARPPFALERLSVSRGPDGRVAKVRSVLPRHKAANRERRPAVTAFAIGNIGKLGDVVNPRDRVEDSGRGRGLPAFLDEAVGRVVEKRAQPAEAVGLLGLVAGEVVVGAGNGAGCWGEGDVTEAVGDAAMVQELCQSFFPRSDAAATCSRT